MKTLFVKTNMMSLFSLVILALAMSSCQNGSGSASTPASTQYGIVNGQCYNLQNNTVQPMQTCQPGAAGVNSSLFQMANGQCMLLQTGQPVNTQYCSTNPFVMQNGQCVDTLQNGAPVSTQFCQGSAVGAGVGAGGTAQCVGSFSYQGQIGQCGGMPNVCSGYTMTSVSSNIPAGQSVRCL